MSVDAGGIVLLLISCGFEQMFELVHNSNSSNLKAAYVYCSMNEPLYIP